MNKKILLGSILSVVILILVSFTSVIGYQSTSNNTKVSPLFNIRSSRAIDKESEDFRCEYVGKGKEITIPIPERNDRKVLYQKVIDYIVKMDDITFNKFISLVIYKIQNSYELNNVNTNKVITFFNQVKNNPEIINVEYNNINFTWCDKTILCFLYELFVILLTIVVGVYFLFLILVICMTLAYTYIFSVKIETCAQHTCAPNPHICPP